MQLKSGTIGWLVAGFVWSIFMGVTVISIGVGSEFPQLNNIAGPFVCPHGQIQVETQGYTVSPVESGYTLTYYCVDNQTGAKAELAFWPKYLIAGFVYGLGIFVLLLVIWVLYRRWDSSNQSAAARKRTGWIPAAVIVAIVICITAFNLMPLFRSSPVAPEPTISAADAAATTIAPTYEAFISGAPSSFKSTEKPLPSWNGIPTSPQAVSGQQVDQHTYVIDVPSDTGTINSFYTKTLPSQGWSMQDSQMLGMWFTKGSSNLLVTLAPAADEQSFVVTLTLHQ